MVRETDNKRTPLVSVIIPSLDGHRDGAVPRLLESVRRQTFQDLEIHVVKGVSPQGRAINQGVDATGGEILLILDDDSEVADETVFASLVEALRTDASIGMAGASIVVAPDATPFQRRAADQFPRFQTPVVEALTDSDLACHGCCAIPRRIFEEVGREREDILRGLDPDLRVRLRAGGYRVVLVPHARIYHPMPNGWRSLLRIFFRNGYGSAYARRYQPDSVYETHEELHDSTFRPRTSFSYRVARFPLRLVKALARGHCLRFVAYVSYAVGYVWGWFTAKEVPHGE